METERKWPNCPFCGDGELTSEYDSYGTTLYCDGCHGQFNFPAFEDEVETMFKKNNKRYLDPPPDRIVIK